MSSHDHLIEANWCWEWDGPSSLIFQPHFWRAVQPPTTSLLSLLGVQHPGWSPAVDGLGFRAWGMVCTHTVAPYSLLWTLVLGLGSGRGKRPSSGTSGMRLTSPLSCHVFPLPCPGSPLWMMSTCLPSPGLLWWEGSQGNCVRVVLQWGHQEGFCLSSLSPPLPARQWACSSSGGSIGSTLGTRGDCQSAACGMAASGSLTLEEWKVTSREG